MLLPFDPAHAERLAWIQATAFAVSDTADTQAWWERLGKENLQLWLEEGELAGGLAEIPMGMYACGRRVSLQGVAGVAIAPEHRGSGAARRMMGAWLRAKAEDGWALSALYASTRNLYRSVGYEVAGERWVGKAHLDTLRAIGTREGSWRPITEADHPAIAAKYESFSLPFTGRMARGPYLWGRVFRHRGKPNLGYLLEGADGPDAWVTLRQDHGNDGFNVVFVEDHFAADEASLQRLAGFLSTFGAMAREITIAGPCALWERMPEHRVSLSLQEPWLLRVIDVVQALEQRGFPAGLSGAFTVEVTDELRPENRGPWRVELEGGRARVTPAATAELKIGVRGLASLYTGHHDPFTLRAIGALRGGDAALPLLAAAFAGPRPQLGDFF